MLVLYRPAFATLSSRLPSHLVAPPFHRIHRSSPPLPPHSQVFYVEAMPKVGGRVATREAGLAFSVESVWAADPFGFHAAYKWVTSEQMAELLLTISTSYSRMGAAPAVQMAAA